MSALLLLAFKVSHTILTYIAAFSVPVEVYGQFSRLSLVL